MLLCGLAASTQASVTNDYASEGNLFMRTHAGAYLTSGGLALPCAIGPTVSSAVPGKGPWPPSRPMGWGRHAARGIDFLGRMMRGCGVQPPIEPFP